MKIMILTNNDVGLYSFRKELIEELVKYNDVYIVVPFGTKIKDLKRIGATYIDVRVDRRGMNPLKDYRLYRTYKRLMKNISPKVVLTYTIKPNIYGGLAAKSLKINYITNITGLGTAVEKKGLLQVFTTFLYKVALKKANTVFFQNQENMDYFYNSRIGNGKFELIPGSGVNTTDFNLEPYPLNNILKFIFIGRIMREKGIEYYLNAAKTFMEKYNNLEFHICGSLEENYEDMILDLTKNRIVIYHGQVTNIKPILKEMNAIIHPTYYPEGMSNVLLESAATGRPAIASNRTGCKEIIEHGKTGYLFEPQNQESLNEAILNFIELTLEEKKAMGIKGRMKVENEFNRQIVIEKYLSKINQIEKTLV